MVVRGSPLLRWLAFALIASAASACGELGRGAPSPVGITFTLTTTECRAEGAGALLPNHIVATVVNRTSSVAAFVVRRMVDGHAFAELDLFISQRQQRIAAGTDRTDADSALPPWTTQQTQSFVNPGQTDTLEADLTSGTYGIVCRRDSATNKDHVEAIYVLGPYRVV